MTSAAQISKEEPMNDLLSMLHYPFPLSTGQVAILALPQDLDAEDAERMAEFVLTLAKGDE